MLKVFSARNFSEKVFGHKNLEIRRTSLACSPVFRDLKNFDSEALQVTSKSNPRSKIDDFGSISLYFL